VQIPDTMNTGWQLVLARIVGDTKCRSWSPPTPAPGAPSVQKPQGAFRAARSPDLAGQWPRRENNALNCLSAERSPPLRRSIKGGSGESVAALRATGRRDRRRLRGRTMYATTAQKSAKKITTKTGSTRVPCGAVGAVISSVLAILSACQGVGKPRGFLLLVTESYAAC
jgi:hypothetical protein